MPKHIDNLQAAINRRKGFAHPNRFSLTFPILRQVVDSEQARDIEFFCESTSIPGRQILTNDYGPTRQTEKRPNGYSNEDVNFVFNLTNDYFIRDVFNRWTNAIVNRDTYEVGYKNDYAFDIFVHQLDEEDTKIYTVSLRDAFPVTVQNIDLNNTTTDSVQKLNVTMAYRDFEELKGEPIGIVPAPIADPTPAGITRNGNFKRNLSRPPKDYLDPTLPDQAAFKQNRQPSGGPLPNKADVIQKRRKIPTIIPFLPPKINQINRIARIFGVTATQPGSAQ